MIRKLSAVLVSFFLALIPAAAQEDLGQFQYEDDFLEEETSIHTDESLSFKEMFKKNFNWAAHGSILIISSGNAKQGADPSPILPSLGGSASWRYSNRIMFEFSEDLYFKNYEYNTQLNMPVPCNQENRSAMVMGFLTGFQVTGMFPLRKTGINIRVFAGPVIDIRIVVLAFGLKHPDDFTGDIETDPKLQTAAIRKYFWANAHWFYPVVGAGADYPINEKYFLGLNLRFWYPLSSATDWRFGLGFRLSPRKNF